MWILWVKKRGKFSFFKLWQKAYTGTEQECRDMERDYNKDEYMTSVQPQSVFA